MVKKSVLDDVLWHEIVAYTALGAVGRAFGLRLRGVRSTFDIFKARSG